MKTNIDGKIISLQDAVRRVNGWKMLGKTTVFTNGVFDLLHAGHVDSLMQAASFGTYLIVGVNSDASVKNLKGDARPVIAENDRARILSAFSCVDVIVLFDDDTPMRLIEALRPDVLVKSADYKPEDIVGAKEVTAQGGEVKITPLTKGLSTTQIIDKIKNLK